MEPQELFDDDDDFNSAQDAPRPFSASFDVPARVNHAIKDNRPKSAGCPGWRTQRDQGLYLGQPLNSKPRSTLQCSVSIHTYKKKRADSASVSTAAGRRPSSSLSFGTAGSFGTRPYSARSEVATPASGHYQMQHKATERELTIAGEGSHTGCRPASASMFESSLYQGQKYNLPDCKRVDYTQQALEKDAARFASKYSRDSGRPSSAQYHVSAPASPQHRKYCARENDDDECPRKGNPPNYPLGVAFNENTLKQWFSTLDRDDSGSISHRELIVGLRRNKQLLSMFQQLRSLHPPEDFDGMSSLFETPVRARAKAMREEVYWIKEILREVDTDFSRTMEYTEFLEFFRRAGLLLEAEPSTRTTPPRLRAQTMPGKANEGGSPKNSPRPRAATNPDAEEYRCEMFPEEKKPEKRGGLRKLMAGKTCGFT